jgi:hypothetical protein
MTVTPNAEFAKRMLLLAGDADEFQPTATYDADGDCIEFLAKPDPFYAERIDDLVTVYYSQETGELIGSHLKGVSKFIAEVAERMPGFKVEVHDGPVRLVHIFRARLWSIGGDPHALTTLTYRKLIDVAGETIVHGAGTNGDALLCR